MQRSMTIGSAPRGPHTEHGRVAALNEVVEALSRDGVDGHALDLNSRPDVLADDGSSAEPDPYREDGGEA
jgi:hypothetical protein